MDAPSPQPAPSASATQDVVWRRRFWAAGTVLFWIALAAIAIYVVGLFITPLSYLIIGMILAYIFYPVVDKLARYIPRGLAILLVFLAALAIAAFLSIAMLRTLTDELQGLLKRLQDFAGSNGQAPSLTLPDLLERLGLSASDLTGSAAWLASVLRGSVNVLASLTVGIFQVFIVALIIGSFTFYLLLDGNRFVAWIRAIIPDRWKPVVNLTLDTADQKFGSFLRGYVVLALVVSVIVGSGAYLLGVPFVLLIMVIVFVCEFIPVFGSYISGPIGILFALTQGWQTGLLYAIFVSIVQGGIDGQILQPRLLGKSVKIYPAIALFLLLMTISVFGLLAVVLIIPLSGVAQVVIASIWSSRHAASSSSEAQAVDGQEANQQNPLPSTP
ncbi:MAG TPA: AI-2E family transporter [Ktedonobacterales bacterium]